MIYVGPVSPVATLSRCLSATSPTWPPPASPSPPPPFCPLLPKLILTDGLGGGRPYRHGKGCIIITSVFLCNE